MEDAVWHQEQAGGGGGRVQVGREVGGPEVDHEVFRERAVSSGSREQGRGETDGAGGAGG